MDLNTIRKKRQELYDRGIITGYCLGIKPSMWRAILPDKTIIEAENIRDLLSLLEKIKLNTNRKF